LGRQEIFPAGVVALIGYDQSRLPPRPFAQPEVLRIQSGQFDFLLHELVPKAAVIGLLVNPNDPNYEADTKAVQAAGDIVGHKLAIVKATSATEIAPAFDALAQQTKLRGAAQILPFSASSTPCPASFRSVPAACKFGCVVVWGDHRLQPAREDPAGEPFNAIPR
jgi:hypothetical protein